MPMINVQMFEGRTLEQRRKRLRQSWRQVRCRIDERRFLTGSAV